MEPDHQEVPPRRSEASEWVILHTPAPQYADVSTIFISQHVKAADASAASPLPSSAGLRARRMRAGGTRAVTWAPTCASQ